MERQGLGGYCSGLAIQKSNDFFDRPNMVGDTRFHRGSDAQTRMNTAEIVIGEVQCDSGFQVRELLAEGIRQPSKAAHRHPH